MLACQSGARIAEGSAARPTNRLPPCALLDDMVCGSRATFQFTTNHAYNQHTINSKTSMVDLAAPTCLVLGCGTARAPILPGHSLLKTILPRY